MVTSRAMAASGRGSIAHIALDCSPRTKAARAGETGVACDVGAVRVDVGEDDDGWAKLGVGERGSAEALGRQLPVAAALGDLVRRWCEVREQLLRPGLTVSGLVNGSMTSVSGSRQTVSSVT